MSTESDVFVKARETAFIYHQAPGRYAITYRGLKNIKDTQGGYLNPWGYNDLLPTFGGMRLEDWIEYKIKQNGIAKLLDVGCGQGNYLIECKERWGKQVECYGITSRIFRTETQIRQGLSEGDVLRGLKAQGLDIRIADAQRIKVIYPEEYFDVITAVHLAEYLADSWSLISGVYSTLERTGVSFINEFPIRLTDPTNIPTLVDYLRSNFGMNITQAHKIGGYYHFAFQNTNQDLILPVIPERVAETKDQDVILFRYQAR